MEDFISHWAKFQSQFPNIMRFGLSVAGAIAILVFGWFTARWLRGGIRNSRFGGSHIDATIRPVFASAVFYVILAMTIYAFLVELGVAPASLLAVFGAAGLAIGLALKDTLGNIASGVMLIAMRPLQVGEFIETPSFSGTVQEIGLFATTVKNLEGLFIYIPNGYVWNNRLQNFNRHTERRLIVDIGVAYDTDLKAAQELLLATMAANPLVQSLPTPPECHVMNFGDSAITISNRCWMPAADWLKNASDMRMALKAALDNEGIEIPFPQRVITTKSA